MNIPENLRYSTDHEWLRVEGNFAFIGITDFASHELGDIVYVDITSLNENVATNEVFGSIEAVKTVSDLLIPVSGTVLEINELLENSPETINSDPYGKGWIVKIKMLDPSEVDKLMDAKAYAKFIEG